MNLKQLEMKKYLSIPALLILLLPVLICSCTGDNNNLTIDDSQNQVIFEDLLLKTKY